MDVMAFTSAEIMFYLEVFPYFLKKCIVSKYKVSTRLSHYLKSNHLFFLSFSGQKKVARKYTKLFPEYGLTGKPGIPGQGPLTT